MRVGSIRLLFTFILLISRFELGYFQSSSISDEKIIYMNRCGGAGCPYSASWLVHLNLLIKTHWWVQSTKMEAASFNIFDKAQNKFQIANQDYYYVHHMSMFEHYNHKKLGFDIAKEKTLQMSKAAVEGECSNLQINEIAAKEYLAIIPFYGGLPPNVTSDLSVKSIGQGNSLVDASTKALQALATLCSSLKYFGHVVIGTARSEDTALIEQLLLTLPPIIRSHTQLVQFSLHKPAHLPFNLIAWTQLYAQQHNCHHYPLSLSSTVSRNEGEREGEEEEVWGEEGDVEEEELASSSSSSSSSGEPTLPQHPSSPSSTTTTNGKRKKKFSLRKGSKHTHSLSNPHPHPTHSHLLQQTPPPSEIDQGNGGVGTGTEERSGGRLWKDWSGWGRISSSSSSSSSLSSASSSSSPTTSDPLSLSSSSSLSPVPSDPVPVPMGSFFQNLLSSFSSDASTRSSSSSSSSDSPLITNPTTTSSSSSSASLLPSTITPSSTPSVGEREEEELNKLNDLNLICSLSISSLHHGELGSVALHRQSALHATNLSEYLEAWRANPQNPSSPSPSSSSESTSTSKESSSSSSLIHSPPPFRPLSHRSSLLKFIYYSECDQVVRFDSMNTFHALSTASNESTFFVGKRREKSFDSDPLDYMGSLNNWRNCGVGGYILSWPKEKYVRHEDELKN